MISPINKWKTPVLNESFIMMVILSKNSEKTTVRPEAASMGKFTIQLLLF